MNKNDFTFIGRNLKKGERLYSQPISYWQDAYRRLKQNKAAVISFWIISIIIVFCIIGPYLNSHNFRNMNHFLSSDWDWELIKKGYFFGVDEFGRDFFTRVWKGGRVSLLIALIVVLVEGVIGTIYGGFSAYIGGKTDMIMMRIVEVLFAVPSMIYIILLMVIFGQGIDTIIIAMGFTRWLPMALLVRGEVLKLKNYEFILASKCLGASSSRIVFKHMIPNILGIIIVRLTLDIPTAIFTEAFLSFIGIGVAAPNCSWGSLANDGYKMLYIAPYLFFIPAVLISIITLTFNVIGDGLRDALDPKLRK